MNYKINDLSDAAILDRNAMKAVQKAQTKIIPNNYQFYQIAVHTKAINVFSSDPKIIMDAIEDIIEKDEKIIDVNAVMMCKDGNHHPGEYYIGISIAYLNQEKKLLFLNGKKEEYRYDKTVLPVVSTLVNAYTNNESKE